MDPDATLRRLRETTRALWVLTEEPPACSCDQDALIALVIEHVALADDLDEWLARGGFRPAAWSLTGQGAGDA